MDDTDRILEQKRKRRSRVQRLRTVIVSTVVVWMVVSLVVMSVLCYKVFSLQQQIDALTSHENTISVNTSVTGSGGYEETGYINSYGDTAEDNLALPEDTLKVYLTFDDGPSANTAKILDILDDYNVKATFFVVGKDDEASLALYKRIVDEGHTLGIHSYTHKYSEIYASLDAFASDLEKMRNFIYSNVGYDCKFYRFPGGSSNQVSNMGMESFIKYLDSQDLTYVDWNVQSGDATTQVYTKDDIVENVMSSVVKYKTSIVLMHDADVKTSTVEALPELIEQLQAEGALLLPINEETTVIQHVTLKEDP